jgi:glycerol-3-phosphate dehydrogenase (NAD(P)+)
MKIAFLGAGVWGFCLARLLSEKGHQVILWDRNHDLIMHLKKQKEHPRLAGRPIRKNVTFTSILEQALESPECIVEAVTSQGVRPVCMQIKELGVPQVPFVITSKGIEEATGSVLSDIAISMLGQEMKEFVGCLSGPGFADEVSRSLPTAIVSAAYSPEIATTIANMFTTSYLRVYPNSDVQGVSFGGALKNIIAIACGISEGLKLGTGAKAALMTRGLHEIVKLAKSFGCKQETLYGLSGMGDLFLTCSSQQSRNFRFGKLLSEGFSPQHAKKEIGMVVEGVYSARAARKQSIEKNISMPITEAICNILDDIISPQDAVTQLMQRSVKEEYL